LSETKEKKAKAKAFTIKVGGKPGTTEKPAKQLKKQTTPDDITWQRKVEE
jgi:hypothetical protein